jgi:hypothetical protein
MIANINVQLTYPSSQAAEAIRTTTTISKRDNKDGMALTRTPSSTMTTAAEQEEERREERGNLSGSWGWVFKQQNGAGIYMPEDSGTLNSQRP